MNMSMMARRKRSFFFLRPWLLRQRDLYVGAVGAFAMTLLFLVFVLLSSSPPSWDNDISRRRTSSSSPPSAEYCGTATTSLGVFGDMMVSMLPKNLAFTVFVPSSESFHRVLRLRHHNDSVAEGKADDATYAVVSRVLGFSAVPRRLRAADVASLRHRQQVVAPVLESVSGLRISAWRRDADGALVVNGLPSVCVDIVKDQVIVHVMTGVLMDVEFEQSFSSEFDN